MLVPKGSGRYELEIKRSLFIAEICGITTEIQAKHKIQERREAHAHASHVVYAFSIGDEKNRHLGMSDDGEPKGTAGRPVLEVLKGSGVTDCLITVVRYFGGTKLGTGGLVHAYSDAAKGALLALKTEQKRDLLPITVQTPYELHGSIRKIIDVYQPVNLTESFRESVTVGCRIDRDRFEEIRDRIRDVSGGEILLCRESNEESS